MIQVQITKGRYRGEDVSGTFPLVRPYNAMGAKGGFITIKNANPGKGHPSVQRIQVDEDSFKMLNAEGTEIQPHETVSTETGTIAVTTNFEKTFIEGETEEEAMERISETFLMLDRIVDASARGEIRGLVVSGPPGVGKSFGVEKQLETANMFRKIQGIKPKFEIVSGGVSPVGLYQKLFYNSSKEHVVVFDDCDGVLFEEESLSLFKAALNSGDRRRICWNKQSRTMDAKDIPEAFDFHGSVIFLSNIDFDASIARESRISSHLKAIMDRCHYLDLEIGSMRDRLLRIRQVIRDGMLEPYEFSEEQVQMLIKYVYDNHEYLRDVSLRMAKKIADWMKVDPSNWQAMTEATCLLKEAKFKRLLEKKRIEAQARGVELAEKA